MLAHVVCVAEPTHQDPLGIAVYSLRHTTESGMSSSLTAWSLEKTDPESEALHTYITPPLIILRDPSAKSFTKAPESPSRPVSVTSIPGRICLVPFTRILSTKVGNGGAIFSDTRRSGFTSLVWQTPFVTAGFQDVNLEKRIQTRQTRRGLNRA